MPASDLTKVTARVLWILGAQSGAFNDTVSDDRYIQEEVKRAVVETETEVVRVVCEHSHPGRVQFLQTSSSLANGSQLPQRLGPIEAVIITRWSGDSGVIGEKTSRDNISRWRANYNNIYGNLAHNAVNSPLAGYYNLTNDTLTYTGLSAVVKYCNYSPNYTALQIDNSFEPVLVSGSIPKLYKLGVPSEIIQVYGQMYSQFIEMIMKAQSIPDLPIMQEVS